MRTDKLRQIAKNALSFALFVVLFLAARSSLADHYYVPSESMLPTLQIGDRIVVNKASYGLRVPFTSAFVTEDEPRVGDVVILQSPLDGKTLVKRVVAVGGDVLEVRGGAAYRNGEARDCRVPQRLCERIGEREVDLGSLGGPPLDRTRVPAGHIYLLGDNRGDSTDSRVFGPVPRDHLRGRAARIYRRDGEFRWIEL